MAADQLATFLAILVFFLLVHQYKWEIPFNLGDAWLRIFAGYPCLLYSKYENYNLQPPRLDLSHAEPEIQANWTCQRFDSDSNTCISLLTACPMTQSSQYSAKFWDRGNTTCRMEGSSKRVDCGDVREEGGICRNLVKKIVNHTTGTDLELVDVKLPASIMQLYTSDLYKDSPCYRQGDVLTIGAGNQSHLSPLFDGTTLRYRINSTFKPRIERISCKSLLDTSLEYCNCGECDSVESGESDKPANVSCPVPVETQITIATAEGKILGVVVKSVWREVDPDSPVDLAYKVIFPPYEATSVYSRFWSARGRFYCPSEVTCWEELWYPWAQWTTVDNYNVVLLLIFAGIFAFVFLLARQ